MSDEVTKLKAELYEKQQEIDELKRTVEDRNDALAVMEAELRKHSDDERQRALNELLRSVQDKEGEIRRLTAQRGKQDERIENLERQARNQKTMESMLTRQNQLASRGLDLAIQLMVDVSAELGKSKYEGLPEELRQRLLSFAFPPPTLHILDFAQQLRKWSTDDAEFAKKLADMGFGQFEQITVDLSKPLEYDDPNT